MATIPITSDTFYTANSGGKFIPLGAPISSNEDQAALRAKVNNEGHNREQFWGTLGKAEQDTDIGWSGAISYSRTGNDSSKGVTLDEIRDIYSVNPAVSKDAPIIERYINFDDVTFPELPQRFSPRDIPHLRLTLFLNPDEGAMVFYHHYTGTWKNERSSELEYILPEPTPAHSCNRDRLTYLFPILPKQVMDVSDDGMVRLGDEHGASFVVKVLVFKRPEAETESLQIVQKGIEYVRKSSSRYKILAYNPESDKFIENGSSGAGLNSNERTLVLFHGTFSSTQGSFGGLLGTDHAPTSWFKQQSQKYSQIIGFDHSTIMHNAEDNLRQFRDMLSGVNFRNNPIDIITFSRGGLVGKQLICGLGNHDFPVRKAALVSCANGVGYFTAARNLGKMLSYLKKSATIPTGGMAGIISLFAQHSAKFFLSRPGAQQMTIGHDSLESILDALPVPQNKDVQMLAVPGRWTRSAARDSRLISRFAQYGTSVITWPILGTPNDFVVNTTRQKILPPGYENTTDPLSCTHTSFFTSKRSAQRVRGHLDNWLG